MLSGQPTGLQGEKMLEKKEKEKFEKITILIVRSILALSFSFFVIYKLWDAQIKIENFDYLYFLSTVIALFAISPFLF